MIKLFKAVYRMLLYLLIVIGSIAVLAWLAAQAYGLYRTQPITTVEPAPVAIVFGAGLWRDGSPTPVLQDRVATAAELYFAGKVKKILMSGDNRFLDYNEPGAMKTYALSLGVPEEDIVLDYAGRRTYDTCYRARAIFGLRQAILVTQKFHLPRALILCNSMGITASGVAADRRDYRLGSLAYWNLREVPAILVTFLEVTITHPVPVLGNAEPIFPGETPTSPF